LTTTRKLASVVFFQYSSVVAIRRKNVVTHSGFVGSWLHEEHLKLDSRFSGLFLEIGQLVLSTLADDRSTSFTSLEVVYETTKSAVARLGTIAS
jgi:hypothetical protein